MASYTAGTSFPKVKEMRKAWWLVNAEDVCLGRLASRIAIVLRGKTKADFTPHLDCGDSVVIINAKKVKITGNKIDQKKFYWHTGYPGGIKERLWSDILRSAHPERLLRKAIERMMPKESPLATQQMKSLYIYAGDQHPHVAQQPKTLSPCKIKIKSEF
jgi:large subunit ribosomal protein L13